MRYLLMICTDENAIGALAPEEGAAMLSEYRAFGEEMGRRGVLLGGERLRPTTDATTVRLRGGELLVADGPFAETKEQVGGYYLVDCRDLDEAVEVASRIPGARHGTIEVRPIWER
ncbi:YciI family protein [Kitasatospora sp. LaBMicrA B282]|uniref:YciI family protein n=1 Tax=Kitasatospora sp. LaBMicrA B282 TaxID=3420949 RepID=UPI003D0AF4C5